MENLSVLVVRFTVGARDVLSERSLSDLQNPSKASDRKMGEIRSRVHGIKLHNMRPHASVVFHSFNIFHSLPL
jgi:hypothetical protein